MLRALTETWHPCTGRPLAAITQAAIQAYATVRVTLPDTLTALRFADVDGCAHLVQQAGFGPPTFQTLPIIWRRTIARDVIDFVTRLSVRAKMLIERSTPSI